jgi:hypothetical protein
MDANDEEPRRRSRRPKPFETLEWSRVSAAVGLDSDEKRERLNRLLVVHLLIDRFSALVLAAKLASDSGADESKVDKLIARSASRNFPDRTQRLVKLRMIDQSVADKISRVNKARNDVVHFKPQKGSSAGWDVEAIEITSQEASESCLKEGIEAVQALWSLLDTEADRTAN